MNRLFRKPGDKATSYAALGLFAAAYLAAMALVVLPDEFLDATSTLAEEVRTGDAP